MIGCRRPQCSLDRACHELRKERDVEPLLVGKAGSFDGEVDGLLHRPLVGMVDEMLRGWYLDGDAVHTAVDSPLDVVNHATAENEYLGAELAFHYRLYRGLVVR